MGSSDLSKSVQFDMKVSSTLIATLLLLLFVSCSSYRENRRKAEANKIIVKILHRSVKVFEKHSGKAKIPVGKLKVYFSDAKITLSTF